LKEANYQRPGFSNAVPKSYDENLTYDKNGNIMTLKRYGNADDQLNLFPIDDLSYEYLANSNKLIRVSEAQITATSGFKDGNTTGDDYDYDANGNLIKDKNKNITTAITYNHLNLPTKIIFPTGNIVYFYNASGQKMQKIVTEGASTTTTDYLGGYQYQNTVLQFFQTAEGYVKNTPVSSTNTYSYVFNYTDYLGNLRLSYTKDPSTNTLTILEENSYYPFGMKHTISNAVVQGQDYKYKYNGKEWQDELGLNVTAMDFRQYDPAIARFNSMDALAEEDPDFTPYRFAYDNPLYWNDPSGLSEEGSNDLTGWVNQGGKTFWDPRVNNAGDVDKLYGDTAKYVPDNTTTLNGDGTSTQYNPDGTKTTLLQEVTITSKPKPKTANPEFSPWGPILIGLGQPLNFLKPYGYAGSKPGSSIASWTLSKTITYRSPLLKQTTRKVAAKIIGKQAAKKVGTAVVGRALGRLVPYVGWGLLANDIYQNWDDVKLGLDAVKLGVETHSRLQQDPETFVCFAKGTLVYTLNGFKPIEEIKTGDITYSYNLEEQKIESSKVMNTLNREVANVFKIITSNETIFVTAEHPIYVIDMGWIKVKGLKVGDVLKSFDGKAKIAILEIQEIKSPITVYNIEVDTNHNYYITNSTILVHNKNITEIKEKSNSILKK
jgi:RHS repeat-associated protein